jgi:hypothetical protein
MTRQTFLSMGLTRIKVECYAGGRADERPRRVILGDRVHTIARLIESSIEESARSRDRIHRFRVMTEDGIVLDILRDERGEWYINQAEGE